MAKDAPILVVVESPKKSRTISKILGSEYIVRPTVGHIYDLTTTGFQRLGVDIDNGFKPQYTLSPDKKDKVASILGAAKQAKLILLAADKDREGEAIACHVADTLKNIKVPIKRITFDEITKSGLEKALKNPKELDYDLYDAQQARRVLDRLVGFMVSPYLISIMGSKLSAGRVQSVCLRLIADREKYIQTFIPETYWNISVGLSKGKKFIAKYPIRINDEQRAKKIKKDLDVSSFSVSGVESNEQKRNPPPPLTTSKLQQAASGRYKFSAKRTMKAAQSLYEAGVITYMRTDSTRNSEESIKAVRKWLKGLKHPLPKKHNIYLNKDSAQDAHEAIRPTDVKVTPKAFFGNDDEVKLYKLIWEFFVGSQMTAAVFNTVVVTVKASKGHELKANGRTLKHSGWLQILKDDRDDLVQLPNLSIGDKLKVVAPKVKFEKKETKPTSRYSEGALIKELERRGIGRPSTYAAIIEKISQRKYVTKSKNVFSPTELGLKVTDTLQKYFSFMKYEYTADMENKLDKIAQGKLDYVKMLGDFFEPFKRELRKARADTYVDGGVDCDRCNTNRMILKHSQYGFFIACSGYPDCKNIKGCIIEGDVDSGNYKIIINEKHKVVDNIVCPKCNSGMVRRDGKFGPFYSCSGYPQCKGSRKIPFGKKCSKCDGELYMTIFGGESKLACMEYPVCKNIENLPEGTDSNWVDPKKIMPEINKKVEKILNEK